MAEQAEPSLEEFGAYVVILDGFLVPLKSVCNISSQMPMEGSLASPHGRPALSTMRSSGMTSMAMA